MGVNHSCRLDRMSDLCDMHTCIERITGRASDDVSNTDTWICRLKEGTMYENKIVTHTFMKIGINPSSVPLPVKKIAAMGLMYELQVYNQLITPILNACICPNFLRSYLVSYNCRRSDLVSALSVGLGVDSATASRHFDRSLSFLEQGQAMRPAVHSMLDGAQYLTPHDSLRLMVLTTEYTDVQTYTDWLSVPHSPQSINTVLLQLIVALCVMALSKLMHNNLSGSNIVVKTLGPPETFTYHIQGYAPITITTRYKVMIHNFNEATSASLGENASFTKSQRFRDLPTFDKRRDLVCLYKNLSTLTDQTGTPLSTLSCIGKHFNMEHVRNTDWHQSRGDETPSTLAEGLTSIVAILPVLPPNANVFIMTRDMFMSDGSLNHDHKVLTDLKWHNTQFETQIIEYTAYLEKCQSATQEVESRLATLAASR